MKIDHVLKAANRAKDLVKQILVFSCQVEQERKPIEFHLIVKEVLKLLHASLPSTIEIRQDIDSKSGSILADPTQMHQVLMNLCTNAFYAMRESGGILEVKLEQFEVDKDVIKTHPTLKESKYVRLVVSDNGVGMSKEIVERVFEPYFTTKDTGEGTGLGLSVVHGILAHHGGDISVYSEPGKGTTFNVYLPWVDTESEEELPDEEIDLEGDERILFIDDEEAIVHLGQEMLENLGYSVTTIISSVEALEIFRKAPEDYDIIITDQIMPEIVGTELAEQIMQIRPGIPVILTSGFSEVVTPEKMDEMGISAYVRKPFVMKELGVAIRTSLAIDQTG